MNLHFRHWLRVPRRLGVVWLAIGAMALHAMAPTISYAVLRGDGVRSGASICSAMPDAARRGVAVGADKGGVAWEPACYYCTVHAGTLGGAGGATALPASVAVDAVRSDGRRPTPPHTTLWPAAHARAPPRLTVSSALIEV